MNIIIILLSIYTIFVRNTGSQTMPPLVINNTQEVLIFQEPNIFENSTKSVVVSKGDSIQLFCYAGGIPIPKVYWHRVNYIPLPSGGSIHRGNILNITNATTADRGVYYCIADNGVGDGARRHIKVEVEFSPRVSVPRFQVAQARNHNVDLECHVDAFPPPWTITWTKDDVLLSKTNTVNFFFPRANEHIVSILSIFDIDESQFGNYTCKATNSLGSDKAVVELIESIAPLCSPTCSTETADKNIEVEM